MAARRSNDDGWRRVVRTVNALGKHVVKVGVFGDDARAQAADGDEITIGRLAGVHEFGAAIQTRWGVILIPERSFIRATVAQNERPYSLLIGKLAASVVDGRRTEAQALAILGARVVADMQKRIARGIEPPNAPSTIARKGSSKPLIDTGRLRQSITYDVVLASTIERKKP